MFGPRAREILDHLVEEGQSTLSETVDICRVDNVRCAGAETLELLRELQRLTNADSCARLQIFGEVYGEINLSSVDIEDLEDSLAIVIKKTFSDEWCFFLTERGFVHELKNETFVSTIRAVWVAADFEAFATGTHTITPWNGTKCHTRPTDMPERPRKLVRDLTHQLTPADIGPWLIYGPAPKPSSVFQAWSRVAVERLIYGLPSEIRSVLDEKFVVLRGPRSAPIQVQPVQQEWLDKLYPIITDAASWVYSLPREAETKFQLLNNHLSLSWHEDLSWPGGLTTVLAGGLVSAREAFAFHLQELSKDALKTLGDLRKALQDEVAKAQTSTRDLLSSLWRDLAIAGIVLALKSPAASQLTAFTTALRYVTVGTACLLLISLFVTIGANWRFNSLADSGRREWRGKLYAFLSEVDWLRLVEKPIRRGRHVYYCALCFVASLYLVAVYYLLYLAIPSLVTVFVNQPLSWIFDRDLGTGIYILNIVVAAIVIQVFRKARA